MGMSADRRKARQVGNAPIALGHLLAMLETLRASSTLPQRLPGGDWNTWGAVPPWLVWALWWVGVVLVITAARHGIERTGLGVGDAKGLPGMKDAMPTPAGAGVPVGAMSGRAWLLLLMPLLLWFGWKVLERHFLLRHLPPELGVHVVLYEESEAWGFGPGGNETGVVLYALPSGVADALAKGDLGVLRQQDRWEQAPMRRGDDRDRYWFEGEGAVRQVGPVILPHLESYLNSYGFGIEVDVEVHDVIDRALSEPGNWYARARSG